MANTTNFNWETPDDTDLVKDGAAAIRTLGNSIDTSFVDLKGGTTGQILSKASNTDLDYTWIANDQGDITEVQAGTGISVASGTGPIPVVTNTVATAYDAKGDLVVGTGADTFSRLAVGGTNGHTLQVDSSTSTGLKWAVDPVADVVTTAGDLIYGTAADTVARLGIGTAGQVLKVNSGATAPEWGAAGASSGPTFSVKSNTEQSVSQSTNTKVTFQVENWDTASNFASSRFTPTTAGYYQINAAISYTGQTGTTFRALIYKNGSPWDNGVMSIGVGVANPTVPISALVYLDGSTDYVELYGWTDSGGTREFYRSYFDGIWIRS